MIKDSIAKLLSLNIYIFFITLSYCKRSVHTRAMHDANVLVMDTYFIYTVDIT